MPDNACQGNGRLRKVIAEHGWDGLFLARRGPRGCILRTCVTPAVQAAGISKCAPQNKLQVPVHAAHLIIRPAPQSRQDERVDPEQE